MKCASCDRESTDRYTRTDRTVDVCNRCLARLELQDAYEDRLLELHELAEDGRFDQALAILDELSIRHAARDHDGWLRRSLLAHRALILGEQGDLEGAIAAQREVLRHTTDPADLVSEGLALATLLERADRFDEAAASAAEALELATGDVTPAALTLLARYASIRGKQQRDLPERHRRDLERAMAWWGMAPPAPDAPLGMLIASADRALGEAEARFEGLQSELARLHGDARARARAVARYLASEPVAFFQRQARDLLP